MSRRPALAALLGVAPARASTRAYGPRRRTDHRARPVAGTVRGCGRSRGRRVRRWGLLRVAHGCGEAAAASGVAVPAMQRRSPVAAAAASVAMAALALATAASVQAAAPAPGAHWQHVAPAAAGFDASELAQIAALARRGHSNCLVVVRRGKLVGRVVLQRHRAEHRAGRVLGDEVVREHARRHRAGRRRPAHRRPRSKWIAAWRGTPSQAVTVRDLLSMDSGRQWDVVTDYLRLLSAPDRTAFAIGLGQDAAPGTEWAYNNSAVQTLDRVLAKATGEDVAAFARSASSRRSAWRTRRWRATRRATRSSSRASTRPAATWRASAS